MTSLDEKLTNILESSLGSAMHDIEKIKQVFKDEGYVQIPFDDCPHHETGMVEICVSCGKDMVGRGAVLLHDLGESSSVATFADLVLSSYPGLVVQPFTSTSQNMAHVVVKSPLTDETLRLDATDIHNDEIPHAVKTLYERHLEAKNVKR